jgi:hypothetical protein
MILARRSAQTATFPSFHSQNTSSAASCTAFIPFHMLVAGFCFLSPATGKLN